LKEPATYEQQIEILRKNGCVIKDNDYCLDVLSRINYYRLSAYLLPFKTSGGKYKAGTNIVSIYKLYEYDRKLRNLIFYAIEEIEVYLRSQFSYYHAHKYGADGYLNAGNYNDRHLHADFTMRINEEINKNRKLPFVRHHIIKYNGEFPIWVVMELFTFGMLSYFYADLFTPDQKQLARNIYKTTSKNLISWLRCCTILRNMCAHSGRLYYSVFSSIPAGIPQLDVSSERRLFGAVMAMRELYPKIDKWNTEILTSISALNEQYMDVINLNHIGFPVNWEALLQK